MNTVAEATGIQESAMYARESFDKELSQLEVDLVLLGDMVERAIFDSLASLKNRDLDMAHAIIDKDDEIDDKQWQIEKSCIRLIRREAPLARDLRRIVTMMELANELERMGDYAEGIAKISLMIGEEPPLKELIDIPKMGEIAMGMVRSSLNSFIENAPERVFEIAQKLAKEDDLVDDLNQRVRKDLFELMKASPENVVRGTYLMWAAHNVERIADRATNIVEKAIFQATGEQVNVGASEPEAISGES